MDGDQLSYAPGGGRSGVGGRFYGSDIPTYQDGYIPVSYTHLTLPTILRV